MNQTAGKLDGRGVVISAAPGTDANSGSLSVVNPVSAHTARPDESVDVPARNAGTQRRPDGRRANELRPIEIIRPAWGLAPGRVIFSMGKTTVLCTCSVEPGVPPFLVGTGKGWLTAEYNMLPGSTSPRKVRNTAKPDGRSIEIQRLIGRSLRTCLDLEKLGERTLWIDCDVLAADGGTRTASINGGFLAVVDALFAIRHELPYPVEEILKGSVAAVSVGLWHGQRIVDLNYAEDKDAEVDLTLVMTGDNQLVEVQAGGEEATFAEEDLHALLELGRRAIKRILMRMKQELGELWPSGRRLSGRSISKESEAGRSASLNDKKTAKSGERK